ncbi:MAG: polysaccharide deacetylase family protein, partial [Actinomycetota bacterium]|nr:polysaccharide deacetylase family protein [Actinomycetota bacterium]
GATPPIAESDPVLLGPRRFAPPSFGAIPASMLPVYTLTQFAARTPGTAPFPHDAVMLTIDDGPDPHWTPKILALLARYHVRATFCLIGRSARAHPTLARAAASEGHLLANHTFSHPPKLTALSDASVRAQIVDAQDAIVAAAGVTPFQFRSPGGNWSAKLLRQLAADKLTAIDWDVDPRDWSRPGPEQIIARMLAARPGDVLLCHDGGGDRSQTYTALQTVLPQLKARGLQFTVLPPPHS